MPYIKAVGPKEVNVDENFFAQVGLSSVGVDSFYVVADAAVDSLTTEKTNLGRALCLLYVNGEDIVDPYWSSPSTTLKVKMTNGHHDTYISSERCVVHQYTIPEALKTALGTSESVTSIACFYFASSVMDNSIGAITDMELIDARTRTGIIASVMEMPDFYTESGSTIAVADLQKYHSAFEPYITMMRSFESDAQMSQWNDWMTNQAATSCKSDIVTYNEETDTNVIVHVYTSGTGYFEMYTAWGEGPPLFKPGWTYTFWSMTHSIHPFSLSLSLDGPQYIEGWTATDTGGTWTVPVTFSGSAIYGKCGNHSGMGTQLGAMPVASSTSDPTSSNRIQVHCFQNFCQLLSGLPLYFFPSFRAGETTSLKPVDDFGRSILLSHITTQALIAAFNLYSKSEPSTLSASHFHPLLPVPYVTGEGNEVIASGVLFYTVYNDILYSPDGTDPDPIKIIVSTYAQFVYATFRFTYARLISLTDLASAEYTAVYTSAQNAYLSSGPLSKYVAAMYQCVDLINYNPPIVIQELTLYADSYNGTYAGFPLTEVTGGLQYTKQTAGSFLRIVPFWTALYGQSPLYTITSNQHVVAHKNQIANIKVKMKVEMANTGQLFVKVYMKKSDSNESPLVVDFQGENREYGAAFYLTLSEWTQPSGGIVEYELVLNRPSTNVIFSSPTQHTKHDWFFSTLGESANHIQAISLESTPDAPMGLAITFESMTINFTNGEHIRLTASNVGASPDGNQTSDLKSQVIAAYTTAFQNSSIPPEMYQGVLTDLDTDLDGVTTTDGLEYAIQAGNFVLAVAQETVDVPSFTDSYNAAGQDAQLAAAIGVVTFLESTLGGGGDDGDDGDDNTARSIYGLYHNMTHYHDGQRLINGQQNQKLYFDAQGADASTATAVTVKVEVNGVETSLPFSYVSSKQHWQVVGYVPASGGDHHFIIEDPSGNYLVEETIYASEIHGGWAGDPTDSTGPPIDPNLTSNMPAWLDDSPNVGPFSDANLDNLPKWTQGYFVNNVKNNLVTKWSQKLNDTTFQALVAGKSGKDQFVTIALGMAFVDYNFPLHPTTFSVSFMENSASKWYDDWSGSSDVDKLSALAIMIAHAYTIANVNDGATEIKPTDDLQAMFGPTSPITYSQLPIAYNQWPLQYQRQHNMNHCMYYAFSISTIDHGTWGPIMPNVRAIIAASDEQYAGGWDFIVHVADEILALAQITGDTSHIGPAYVSDTLGVDTNQMIAAKAIVAILEQNMGGGGNENQNPQFTSADVNLQGIFDSYETAVQSIDATKQYDILLKVMTFLEYNSSGFTGRALSAVAAAWATEGYNLTNQAEVSASEAASVAANAFDASVDSPVEVIQYLTTGSSQYSTPEYTYHSSDSAKLSDLNTALSILSAYIDGTGSNTYDDVVISFKNAWEWSIVYLLHTSGGDAASAQSLQSILQTATTTRDALDDSMDSGFGHDLTVLDSTKQDIYTAYYNESTANQSAAAQDIMGSVYAVLQSSVNSDAALHEDVADAAITGVNTFVANNPGAGMQPVDVSNARTIASSAFNDGLDASGIANAVLAWIGGQDYYSASYLGYETAAQQFVDSNNITSAQRQGIMDAVAAYTSSTSDTGVAMYVNAAIQVSTYASNESLSNFAFVFGEVDASIHVWWGATDHDIAYSALNQLLTNAYPSDSYPNMPASSDLVHGSSTYPAPVLYSPGDSSATITVRFQQPASYTPSYGPIHYTAAIQAYVDHGETGIFYQVPTANVSLSNYQDVIVALNASDAPNGSFKGSLSLKISVGQFGSSQDYISTTTPEQVSDGSYGHDITAFDQQKTDNYNGYAAAASSQGSLGQPIMDAVYEHLGFATATGVALHKSLARQALIGFNGYAATDSSFTELTTSQLDNGEAIAESAFNDGLDASGIANAVLAWIGGQGYSSSGGNTPDYGHDITAFDQQKTDNYNGYAAAASSQGSLGQPIMDAVYEHLGFATATGVALHKSLARQALIGFNGYAATDSSFTELTTSQLDNGEAIAESAFNDGLDASGIANAVLAWIGGQGYSSSGGNTPDYGHDITAFDQQKTDNYNGYAAAASSQGSLGQPIMDAVYEHLGFATATGVALHKSLARQALIGFNGYAATDSSFTELTTSQLDNGEAIAESAFNDGLDASGIANAVLAWIGGQGYSSSGGNSMSDYGHDMSGLESWKQDVYNAYQPHTSIHLPQSGAAMVSIMNHVYGYLTGIAVNNAQLHEDVAEQAAIGANAYIQASTLSYLTEMTSTQIQDLKTAAQTEYGTSSDSLNVATVVLTLIGSHLSSNTSEYGHYINDLDQAKQGVYTAYSGYSSPQLTLSGQEMLSIMNRIMSFIAATTLTGANLHAQLAEEAVVGINAYVESNQLPCGQMNLYQIANIKSAAQAEFASSSSDSNAAAAVLDLISDHLNLLNVVPSYGHDISAFAADKTSMYEGYAIAASVYPGAADVMASVHAHLDTSSDTGVDLHRSLARQALTGMNTFATSNNHEYTVLTEAQLVQAEDDAQADFVNGASQHGIANAVLEFFFNSSGNTRNMATGDGASVLVQFNLLDNYGDGWNGPAHGTPPVTTMYISSSANYSVRLGADFKTGASQLAGPLILSEEADYEAVFINAEGSSYVNEISFDFVIRGTSLNVSTNFRPQATDANNNGATMIPFCVIGGAVNIGTVASVQAGQGLTTSISSATFVGTFHPQVALKSNGAIVPAAAVIAPSSSAGHTVALETLLKTESNDWTTVAQAAVNYALSNLTSYNAVSFVVEPDHIAVHAYNDVAADVETATESNVYSIDFASSQTLAMKNFGSVDLDSTQGVVLEMHLDVADPTNVQFKLSKDDGVTWVSHASSLTESQSNSQTFEVTVDSSLLPIDYNMLVRAVRNGVTLDTWTLWTNAIVKRIESGQVQLGMDTSTQTETRTTNGVTDTYLSGRLVLPGQAFLKQDGTKVTPTHWTSLTDHPQWGSSNNNPIPYSTYYTDVSNTYTTMYVMSGYVNNNANLVDVSQPHHALMTQNWQFGMFHSFTYAGYSDTDIADATIGPDLSVNFPDVLVLMPPTLNRNSWDNHAGVLQMTPAALPPVDFQMNVKYLDSELNIQDEGWSTVANVAAGNLMNVDLSSHSWSHTYFHYDFRTKVVDDLHIIEPLYRKSYVRLLWAHYGLSLNPQWTFDISLIDTVEFATHDNGSWNYAEQIAIKYKPDVTPTQVGTWWTQGNEGSGYEYGGDGWVARQTMMILKEAAIPAVILPAAQAVSQMTTSIDAWFSGSSVAGSKHAGKVPKTGDSVAYASVIVAPLGKMRTAPYLADQPQVNEALLKTANNSWSDVMSAAVAHTTANFATSKTISFVAGDDYIAILVFGEDVEATMETASNVYTIQMFSGATLAMKNFGELDIEGTASSTVEMHLDILDPGDVQFALSQDGSTWTNPTSTLAASSWNSSTYSITVDALLMPITYDLQIRADSAGHTIDTWVLSKRKHVHSWITDVNYSASETSTITTDGVADTYVTGRLAFPGQAFLNADGTKVVPSEWQSIHATLSEYPHWGNMVDQRFAVYYFTDQYDSTYYTRQVIREYTNGTTWFSEPHHALVSQHYDYSTWNSFVFAGYLDSDLANATIGPDLSVSYPDMLVLASLSLNRTAWTSPSDIGTFSLSPPAVPILAFEANLQYLGNENSFELELHDSGWSAVWYNSDLDVSLTGNSTHTLYHYQFRIKVQDDIYLMESPTAHSINSHIKLMYARYGSSQSAGWNLNLSIIDTATALHENGQYSDQGYDSWSYAYEVAQLFLPTVTTADVTNWYNNGGHAYVANQVMYQLKTDVRPTGVEFVHDSSLSSLSNPYIFQWQSSEAVVKIQFTGGMVLYQSEVSEVSAAVDDAINYSSAGIVFTSDVVNNCVQVTLPTQYLARPSQVLLVRVKLVSTGSVTNNFDATTTISQVLIN